MFYKPEKGGIWDPSVLYFKGKYYALCMYFRPESEKWDGMWAAESEDGVHWKDVGCVLTAEHDVYKMFAYICGDKCLINYGSSRTIPGKDNDTLYFCESEDMRTWTEFLENHPDSRWYKASGRWDHMYVTPKDDGAGYWGYVVATPLPEYHSAWGLLESPDGYCWEILPPPVIEWGKLPEIGMLEGGGCEKIGDSYYYIGGAGGYARNGGYGLYTFRSASPTGPFYPDETAFRLRGFDRLPGRVFTQNLAAFCRGENGELLVSNAFDAGGTGNVWLLQMRSVVVDEEGHLHLGYWEKNDRAKGRPLPLENCYNTLITERPGRRGTGEGGRLEVRSRTELLIASDRDHPGFALTDAYTLAVQTAEYDLEQGILAQGNFTAAISPAGMGENAWPDCWRNAAVGLYIEYEGRASGLAFLLELGHPYHRTSTVETLTLEALTVHNEVLDVTGEGCATLRGVDAGALHGFKLFVRGVMAELYVDGLLVQSFPLLDKASGRVGFVARNAECLWEELEVYQLDV